MKRRDFLRMAGVGSAAGLATVGARTAHAAPRPPRIIGPENPGDPATLAMPGSRSALIIGGGLAGLSAALELAERGFAVTLREAAPFLGGRLACPRVTTDAGDFNVEHGLHMWFDNYHVFRDIRARLGIDHYFRPYNEIHFVYRDYQPEVLKSEPPIYPLNLVQLLVRSPNMNVFSALKQFGLLGDVMFFDYEGLYSRLDDRTFPEWAAQRHVSKTFYDVLLEPAASVTLNDIQQISAAEMVLYMHYYFIGQPHAMDREITTVDHATAVLDPWAARLASLGVDIQLGRPVAGLRFADGRAIGEAGTSETFDYVVMATSIPGAQTIMSGSYGEDAQSDMLLAALHENIAQMKVAPPYKVLRVWLDDRPAAHRPDLIETPQHPPINLLAQFHLLEDESKAWADATGGSVLEFHLYANDMWADVPDQDVWPLIRPTVLELLPELSGASVVAQTVGSHHDFSSFEVGQGLIRPTSTTPAELGIANMTLAGDWMYTRYPSALMERAVATGREAANHILLAESVRQVAMEVTASRGPGLF